MPHVKGTPCAPASQAAGVVLDLARSAADEGEARAWADDSAFLAWAEVGGGASVIAAELKVCVGRRGGRAFVGVLQVGMPTGMYGILYCRGEDCNTWNCWI